ncbi:MAG TPA: hypothetical protein VHM30_05170, partial [Gemmatimonadaceae bacterium]|nr:hypothetical protein [Gemmatimonadaceae bacterium]
VIAARGQRSAQAAQWLGTRQVSVRTERARRGGITRASWFDTSGQLVQAWIDRDLDGRADAVQLFRNGQLLRTLTR